MAVLSANPDMVAFAAKRLPQRFFRVKRNTVLVKIRLFKIFAEADKTAVRFQTPGQKFDKRGFAGAVGTDDADFIAFDNPNRKIFHNIAAAKALKNMFGLNYQFGTKIAFGNFQINTADTLDLFLALQAQLLQTAQASHIATAAGGYAFV